MRSSTVLLLTAIGAVLCGVASGQCETAGAPALGFNFGNAARGIQFDCTSGTVIDRWGHELAPMGAVDLDLAVYESTDAGVSWSRIDNEVFLAVTPAVQFYMTSSGRNITLVAGRRYAFMTYACGSCGYNADFGSGFTTSFASFNPAAGGIPASARDSGGCTSMPTATIAGDISGFTEIALHTRFCTAGPICTINGPAAGAMVSGTVVIDADLDHVLGLQVDATYEYSTDVGATWSLCTPVGGANPVMGVVTPSPSFQFQWDSAADMVGVMMVQPTTIRITVDDGSQTSSCTVTGLQVDNLTPVPTCTLTLTGPAPVRGVGGFELVADSVSASAVDATYTFSTDGGATWSPATPGPGSTNPTIGVPIMTPTPFAWDTTTDAVGTAVVAPGVLLRAGIDDGVGVGQCTTTPFDVDNTALCGGICGDCSLDGVGPNILDALEAARISAGLLAPTPAQVACCDVNASMSVDVLDALSIAQEAAGLSPVLMCP